MRAFSNGRVTEGLIAKKGGREAAYTNKEEIRACTRAEPKNEKMN